VLGIHNSITGEKGAANGALEKMAIGRLLVSVSTPLYESQRWIWAGRLGGYSALRPSPSKRPST